MKLTVGAAARKERFFRRDNIRERILAGISNQENLLLSAPRRIGKTSILQDLQDRPDENVYAVYVDTEDFKDPEDFFKALLDAILDADLIENFGFTKGAKEFLTKWAKRIVDIKIGFVEVKVKEKDNLSFYQEFVDFLTEIKLEGKVILLMIDEFPITIENIANKHGIVAAINFLSQNRALRQNPKINEKIKFVYTGSIGLFTAVKKLSGTDRINDLREMKVPPLTKGEAVDLTNQLLIDKIKTTAPPEVMEYILLKIEWWIPFYFQLLVAALGDLINYDKLPFTPETVDRAFEQAAENGDIYFEHFKSRLGKIFKDGDLAFAVAFMLQMKTSPLSINDTIDLSVAKGVPNNVNDIIDILKHDGYIVEDAGYYKFYSPLLKKWWK